MNYFTVNTDEISGRFGTKFHRGDKVKESQFQPNITPALVSKGLIVADSENVIYRPPQPQAEYQIPVTHGQGLKVYQIYYSEDHLGKLDYTPYLNSECSIFFEHSVMVDLINSGSHIDFKYFGVVSHSLREKITISKTSWRNIKNIANVSINQFTPESFARELMVNQPDVMSFQRHIPHDPISFGNSFHTGMSDFFKKIMLEIGYNWSPVAFQNVFYCNYFVAKSAIYEEYVKAMLEPAMDVMMTMPELLKNSGYPKKLPEHLRAQWGIDFYPYHTFLCERMFSYYVHLKKLKCLHY